MKDFFISYNQNDRQWAEWIAWILESEGYTVVIQAWDFRPGGNFVLDMHRAVAETQKTIAVLSNTYLASAYTQPEWAAAFANDPLSVDRKLLPIKVKECNPSGLLRPLQYVSFVGISEAEARQRLLESLKDRVKPETKPDFPKDIDTVEESSKIPTSFPLTKASLIEAFNEQKFERLTNRFNLLQEDWDALSDQLDAEDDAARRNSFERKLVIIEKNMAKVAAQLDSLRA